MYPQTQQFPMPVRGGMDARRLSDYGKSNNRPSFMTVASIPLLQSMYNAKLKFNPLGNQILPYNIASGTLGGTQSVGGSNVNINGSSKNITMSDGTNTRLLIGYQQGGF
jgi:hypothetical protein